MGGRQKKHTVELIPEQVRGEYGDASYFLTFIFWNYYEQLPVIRTNGLFLLYDRDANRRTSNGNVMDKVSRL